MHPPIGRKPGIYTYDELDKAIMDNPHDVFYVMHK